MKQPVPILVLHWRRPVTDIARLLCMACFCMVLKRLRALSLGHALLVGLWLESCYQVMLHRLRLK